MHNVSLEPRAIARRFYESGAQCARTRSDCHAWLAYHCSMTTDLVIVACSRNGANRACSAERKHARSSAKSANWIRMIRSGDQLPAPGMTLLLLTMYRPLYFSITGGIWSMY